MNARLDENEAEFGVLVLAVALKVLADCHSLQSGNWSDAWRDLRHSHKDQCRTYLFDQHVEVLGDFRSEA